MNHEPRMVTATRALSGLAVLALTAGAVVGAGALAETEQLTAASLAVEVPPTEVAIVCPAPATGTTGGGSDSELGGASQVSSTLVAGVLARPDGLGAAALTTLGEDTPGTDLTVGADAAAATTSDVEGAVVLRAQPTATAAFAGVGLTQRALSGDLRGLAAIACPSGATTSWFAAGRTLVGSSTLLRLANPGSTAATVSVRVWGETGEVSIDRGEIVVGPGQSIDQAIEAIAPDLSRLAIQVSSRGGGIAASLLTSDLTGLTAGGTDLVGATGGPATQALVPGVVLGSSSVDDEDASLVRILNPGDEPAEVDLELLGVDAVTYLGGEQRFTVDPGVVAEISLAGSPPGTYTLRATSSLPVVVGASLVRVGGPDPMDPDVPLVDRAWLGSVPPAVSSTIPVSGLGSLADRAVLVLAGAAQEDVEVAITAIGADGAEVGATSVTVPAGRSQVLDVADLSDAATLLRIETVDGEGVSAAVVLSYADELGELVSVVSATEDPQRVRTVHIAVTAG